MVNGKCYSIYYHRAHKENIEKTVRAIGRLYSRDAYMGVKLGR